MTRGRRTSRNYAMRGGNISDGNATASRRRVSLATQALQEALATAKLHCDEASAHFKAGHYSQALNSYDQKKILEMHNILQGSLASTELLQSFVRNDRDSDEEQESDEAIKADSKNKTKLPPLGPIGKKPAAAPIIASPPKRDLYTPRGRKEDFTSESPTHLNLEQRLASEKTKDHRDDLDTRFSETKGKRIKFKVNRARKRRIQRAEEIYTDKDRAAAVNMGSRDIKQSLSLKMKQDRSKSLQIPEEAEPGTFLALGNRELRNGGDVTVALDCINKALQLHPKDKEALVARSKCFILLGEPDKSLADAEAALKLDKAYVQALYQKAESLYFQGQFEHSLMYYHRGLRIRPESQKFRLGVEKAQEAIINTIGANVKLGSGLKEPRKGPSRTPSRPGSFVDRKLLSASPPTIKISSDKISRASSTGQSNESKVSVQTSKRAATANPANKKSSTKHLLGALAVDKLYLEKLINEPNIKCLDKENRTVLAKANEALMFLQNRQKFWQQQLPPPGLNKNGKKNSSSIVHR